MCLRATHYAYACQSVKRSALLLIRAMAEQRHQSFLDLCDNALQAFAQPTTVQVTADPSMPGLMLK